MPFIVSAGKTRHLFQELAGTWEHQVFDAFPSELLWVVADVTLQRGGGGGGYFWEYVYLGLSGEGATCQLDMCTKRAASTLIDQSSMHASLDHVNLADACRSSTTAGKGRCSTRCKTCIMQLFLWLSAFLWHVIAWANDMGIHHLVNYSRF